MAKSRPCCRCPAPDGFPAAAGQAASAAGEDRRVSQDQEFAAVKAIRFSEEMLKAHQAKMQKMITPRWPKYEGPVRQYSVAPKRAKHGNVKTVRHGIKFDSRHEADMFDALLMLEKQGNITHLQRQVSFPLEVKGS